MNEDNEASVNENGAGSPGPAGAPVVVGIPKKPTPAGMILWSALFAASGAGVFGAWWLIRALFGRANWAVLISGRETGAAVACACAVGGLGLLVLFGAGVRRRKWMELGIAGGAVFVLSATLWYPRAYPQPLAGFAPDDTRILVSMDVVDAAGLGNSYIKAMGKQRLLDEYSRVTGKVKFDLDLAKTGRRLGRYTIGWMTREVLVIAGDVTENEDDYAVLFGSWNRERAERNFPKILRFIQDTMADAIEGADPEEAKSIREETAFEFEKISYKKNTLYRMKSKTKSPDGEEDASGDAMCWASVPRALVVAGNMEYLKKVVDSLASDKRTKRQKHFARVQQKSVGEKRPVYVYVDGRLLRDQVEGQLRAASKGGLLGDEEGIDDFTDDAVEDYRKELHELQAMKGIEYSFTYTELDPRHEVSVLLDEKRVPYTEYLKYLERLESRPHRMDKLLDHENALFYFSTTSLAGILRTLYDLDKEGVNALCSEIGIKAPDLLNAVGDEFGLAVMDVRFRKNMDMPVYLDMILALELNPEGDSRATISKAAGKIASWLSTQGDLSLEKRDGDFFVFRDLTLGKHMKPTLAVTSRYMFFGMNPDTVRKHMNGGMGKRTDVSSVARMRFNPARIADTLQDYLDHMDDMDEMFAFDDLDRRNTERGLESAIKSLQAQGPTSLLFHVDKDKVSFVVEQDIRDKFLGRIPVKNFGDMIIDSYEEGERRNRFDECADALREADWGVRYYMEETGGLADLTRPADTCSVMADDETMASCIKKVVDDVRNACVADTYEFEVVSDTEYELRARAPGESGCWICMTESQMTPDWYMACEKNGEPSCVHELEYTPGMPDDTLFDKGAL